MADYGKEQIINILIKRDGISKSEAESIFEECNEIIADILDSEMNDFERSVEIELAIKDCLGLEPDYIFAFL